MKIDSGNMKQLLWDTRYPAQELRALLQAAIDGRARTEPEKLVQIVARQQEIPEDVAQKFLSVKGIFAPKQVRRDV